MTTEARLTEAGLEWRDRATEAEGLIDTLGAMRERAEILAAEWQDDNARLLKVIAGMDVLVVKWMRLARDVSAQRDEALRLAAGVVE